MNMMKSIKKKKKEFPVFLKIIKFGLYFLEIHGNPLDKIDPCKQLCKLLSSLHFLLWGKKKVSQCNFL